MFLILMLKCYLLKCFLVMRRRLKHEGFFSLFCLIMFPFCSCSPEVGIAFNKQTSMLIYQLLIEQKCSFEKRWISRVCFEWVSLKRSDEACKGFHTSFQSFEMLSRQNTLMKCFSASPMPEPSCLLFFVYLSLLFCF